MRLKSFSAAMLAIGLLSPCGAGAGDLDDGISSYTDDPISAMDQLGSPDINVGFIVLQAKSRAASSLPSGMVSPVSEPSANMNSVVIEPGSTVNGNIIVIDQSYGNKTQIVSGGEKFISGFSSASESMGGSSSDSSGGSSSGGSLSSAPAVPSASSLGF